MNMTPHISIILWGWYKGEGGGLTSNCSNKTQVENLFVVHIRGEDFSMLIRGGGIPSIPPTIGVNRFFNKIRIRTQQVSLKVRVQNNWHILGDSKKKDNNNLGQTFWVKKIFLGRM